MTKRRVVVTGLGAVTPVGIGTDKFWNSLINGKSGVSTIENMPLEGHTVTISAEIKNEDYNPDLVTLCDDSGKEYTFEVLDAIETDTGRYLAMLPIYEDPKKMLDDNGELVIVRVEEENGEEGELV